MTTKKIISATSKYIRISPSKVDLIIERKKDARFKKIHENLKVLRIRD